MSGTLETIVLGAIGSLLAALIVWWVVRSREWLKRFWNARYRLASILQEGGITRFTLSRRSYGPLRLYLATATHSIDFVSISMNVTQAEGALISLFEQRINENATFRVRITLLNPDSPVVTLLAKSLDIEPQRLKADIVDMLSQLWSCKMRLPPDKRKRLEVLIHDTHPIGSAILLDARPDGGRIQIETKLYRAPRTESFGFEITGPSEFFTRNYEAWQKVFDDSREYIPGTLVSSEAPLFQRL